VGLETQTGGTGNRFHAEKGDRHHRLPQQKKPMPPHKVEDIGLLSGCGIAIN